jgi:hypothetical protein
MPHINRAVTQHLSPIASEGIPMRNIASRFFTVLFPLLIVPVVATSQVTIDATGPIHERQRIPQRGSSGSTGYRLPLRITIALRNGPRDKNDSAVVEFILTNLSEKDQTIPVSPNPGALESTDPKVAYSVKHLGLYLTSDKKQELIVTGGAQLYGSRAIPETLVKLAPGESIHVLAKVELKSHSSDGNSSVFVAHAVLNDETVRQTDGETVMDSQEIGSAASSEYTPESLSKGG